MLRMILALLLIMFTCNNCSQSFRNIGLYNKHQLAHRDLPNLKIKCLFPQCQSESRSYLGFRQHIFRNHSDSEEGYYTCHHEGCDVQVTKIKSLKKHYGSHFKNLKSPIICGFCTENKATFGTKNAYKIHITRHHPDIYDEVESHDFMVSDEAPSVENGIITNNNIQKDVESNSHSHLFESSCYAIANALQDDVDYDNHSDTMPSTSGAPPSSQNCVENNSCYAGIPSSNAANYAQNDVENHYHSDVMITSSPSATAGVQNGVENSSHFNTITSTSSSTTNAQNAVDHSSTIPKPGGATDLYSQLYLNLSANHFATEPLIQEVVNTTSSAFQICKEQFATSLKNSSLTENDKNSVENMFQESFESISSPHDAEKGIFRSTYTRNAHRHKNPNYIQPIDVPLCDPDGAPSGDHYTYVPILETLNIMLKDEFVHRCCANPDCLGSRNTSTNAMFDISDGNVYKNNCFFRENKKGLQRILFQDAFEVVSPIGAAKKKYKVVAVYMILGNLPPWARSKTKNIKLVLLCLEENINVYGWKHVLQKLLGDLEVLETDGLGFSFPGESEPVRGSLLCITGDNLGSNQIGGFNENFSTSHYCCRFCEQTQEELRTDPFCPKPKRTVQSYTDCVDEAMRTGKAYKGIKHSSPLNALKYFHVCSPGLPPCIAHDIFEGIAAFDMQLAISYFIKKGWFTAELLNHRLKDIKLSLASQVCIPPVKADSKRLSGTASHIRRLIMIFPVLVADKIDNFSDDVWRMVLSIRTVCDFDCAPSLSHDQIGIFQDAIRSYIQLRMKCFPLVPLRPKQGFVLHHPGLIYDFGPLKHVWTLRFESEHQFMKKVMKHNPNYKNVTQLLAEKHELMQSSRHDQYDDLVVLGNFTEYCSVLYSDAINKAIDASKNSNVKYVSTKVNFRGIQYVANDCICIGKSMSGNFLICKISLILVNADRTSIHFLGSTNEIIYNCELGVYELEENENFANNELQTVMSCFSYGSLLSPDPLVQAPLSSKTVYLTKYVPFDNSF